MVIQTEVVVVVVVVNQNSYGYSSSLLNGFLLLVEYLSTAQDLIYSFLRGKKKILIIKQ